MTRDGRITDGKTILLLQWAALEGPSPPRRAAADNSPWTPNGSSARRGPRLIGRPDPASTPPRPRYDTAHTEF